MLSKHDYTNHNAGVLLLIDHDTKSSCGNSPKVAKCSFLAIWRRATESASLGGPLFHASEAAPDSELLILNCKLLIAE